MAWLEGIGGILLDVDGTLLDGDRAIAGAPEAVARFRDAGLALRFTTNTTRRSRAAIAEVLRAAGIPAASEEVIVPASLARRRIADSGASRAILLVAPGAKADLAGVLETEESPDWVVVGDLGPGFTFDAMNAAYRALRGGARLLALHKNRAWWAGEERGMVLDAGAYVAALEYAAGTQAEVVGKPARGFFDLAVREIGRDAAVVLAVGDNVENDFLGASAAGCKTALVRGGAFREDVLVRSPRRPDLLVGSVAELTP